MKSFIERAWYKGHPVIWILWPLMQLYKLVTSLRRLLYKLGIKKRITLPVPVIVVGNITVGGNGKTPVVVWLAKLLTEQGFNVGVISRGYGGQSREPLIVRVNTSAEVCGDEPKLIVNQTGCLMAVGADRISTAKLLLEYAEKKNSALDIIISDDGLQHYRLDRQSEIVVVDGERRFGNECLLPMGPLREGKWRLGQADLIINNGGSSCFGEERMQLQPQAFCSVANNEPVEHINIVDKKIVAMAGIGYPQRFFNTLTTMGLAVDRQHAFADHQAFDSSTINALTGEGEVLLMTEKDAVKCQAFAQDNWFYLPVSAKLTDTATQKILDKVKEIKNGF
ncbi:tetraacyldisaccharide 4'-kinase [Psychrobium sp. 1_MG-2023]|uniref:tetraacyldisaccharide 4'-kinase n=1 Tax=Psychrobium sp. 1_MG-2023 TaxID=3062624 RepID=UPI0027334E29|nr:tetraacyldisaccharide 4'-kinase [Psychrobium sp. 1_MG-2023]MDP2560281.1 tetraacyldisaccharide 4'-kinase [Psychrobium sp. 1_MG-2023]